jgi:hypothetical protein
MVGVLFSIMQQFSNIMRHRTLLVVVLAYP